MKTITYLELPIRHRLHIYIGTEDRRDEKGNIIGEWRNTDVLDESAPSGPKETYVVGERLWFEYHCNESDDSLDVELRDRSHQQVTVTAVDLTCDGWHIDTEQERWDAGQPMAYTVKFDDGFVGVVTGDELSYDKSGWYRPDPPHNRPGVVESDEKGNIIGEWRNWPKGEGTRRAMCNVGPKGRLP